MYGLDLQDPRLVLPVPIYRHPTDNETQWAPGANLSGQHPPEFMAPRSAARRTRCPTSLGRRPALSANDQRRWRSLVLRVAGRRQIIREGDRLLFEYSNGKNYWYAADGSQVPEGYERGGKPLGRVWENSVWAGAGRGLAVTEGNLTW